MKFSVLILTRDSEEIIDGLLDCLKYCDDVVLVNDRSRDNTSSKAKKYSNVRLFETEDLAKNIVQLDLNKNLFYGDEAYLRNLTINKIDFKYDWILILDSDERISQSSLNSLKKVALKEEFKAISLIRFDNFLGKRLKYSQQVSRYIRLINKNYCTYKRPINSFIDVRGKIFTSKISFDHYPFIKGIDHWINKHIEYSKLESVKAYKAKSEIIKVFNPKIIFNNPIRQLYKNIFYLLYLRGIIKFLILYIFKFGFLDGLAGYIYCSLICWYETLIEIRQKIISQKTKI